MDVSCRYMCVSGGAFIDCTCDILSLFSLSWIDFYLLIRYCMTNSFTTVSSINLKSALPVVSIHMFIQKLLGAIEWLTRLLLSSCTLRMYTNARHCFIFFILIVLPLLLLPSILGDTHAHLCIHGCRSNRAPVSNLDPLEHGSRSVEQLCIGPDILTYISISSFVSIMGKQRKVEKPTRWSLGCYNGFILLFRDPKVSQSIQHV